MAKQEPEFMTEHCCHPCHEEPPNGNNAYLRILWVVLAVNAAMFAVEIGTGLAAGCSVSLWRL
jgi:Co/Zn/Cd efflux system component